MTDPKKADADKPVPPGRDVHTAEEMAQMIQIGGFPIVPYIAPTSPVREAAEESDEPWSTDEGFIAREKAAGRFKPDPSVSSAAQPIPWMEAMREEFIAYDLADNWTGNDWVDGLFKIIAAHAPQAAPSSSASAELQYICDWLGIDGVDMANPNRAETIAKLIKKLIQASSSASENEIRRQLDVLKRNLQSTAERYTAERRVK